MTKRWKIALSVLVCFAISVSVPGAGVTAPKEVVIGVISSLSGANAPQGRDVVDGHELAAEIANGYYEIDLPLARGTGLPNLGGAKVRLVIADSQGSAEVGMAEAERLITMRNVSAIVGTNQSAVTKTVSQICERYGIPCVNDTSTAPPLTQRGLQWYFRATPDDHMFVGDSFSWLKDLNKAKKAGLKTLAIINENTEFGAQIAEVERTAVSTQGFNLVADITYSPGTADLKGEAMRLKNANPDVVMATGYTSDAILLIKTLKEVDFAPKIFLGHRGGYALHEFVKALGNDSNYICTTGVWAADIPETNKTAGAINELFRTRTGRSLTSESSRSFTAMLALLEAVNRAGSTSPDAIRKALLATDISASQLIIPWSGIRYDPKTHQNLLGGGIVTQIVGGEFRTVWPFQAASRDLVFPLPSWSSR